MVKNKDDLDRRSLIEEQTELIYRQQEKLQRLEKAYLQKCIEYNEVISSKAWKLTAPLRFAGNIVKWALRLQAPGYSPWSMFKTRPGRKKRIAQATLFSKADLKKQTAYVFEKNVKISIVVPLYNTPDAFLRKMIQSVLAQTYSNWELCLADGSDAEHPQTEKICRDYEKRDDRIHYRRLRQNYGISANTNAALEMATGDYVGLLDHDDLLHPAALHEAMHAICEQNADLVYTDEAHFHISPRDADNAHFKPDFAPDTLCANNYICHFTVFRRSLLDRCGTFASECDGSQDHDMILRLTEKAERISHIPEILYYWREHPNSVAANVGIKPYVFEAGIYANQRRLDRFGIRGSVSTVNPGTPIYRIRYEISGRPKISIVIRANENSGEELELVRSILKRTKYDRYEIILLKKDSSGDDKPYNDHLQAEHPKIRMIRLDMQIGDSQACNEAVRQCSGDYIVILRADMIVHTPRWLEEMLMYCQQPDVGAVGVKIINPDKTIRHAGIGLGIHHSVGWFFKGLDADNEGYMGRLVYAQNVSAVSGGCVMLSRKAWQAVNGLDETFSGDWSVIDLCLRLRKADYLNVWTPFAELMCYGNSRKPMNSGEEKSFLDRWKEELEAGDPYFNPNFDQGREDFLPDMKARKLKARCVVNRRLLPDE